MHLGILVNRTFRQTPTHTSLHLAFEAVARGHRVRYLSIDGFAMDADSRLYGWTVPCPPIPAGGIPAGGIPAGGIPAGGIPAGGIPAGGALSTTAGGVAGRDRARAAFTADLTARALSGPLERIDLATLDVLLLRNNPADHQTGPDAVQGNPALAFGRKLRSDGVLVLNDPDGIARAGSKLTLLADFPTVAQPRTLVAKRPEELRAFLRDLGGPAVVKPLSGFGGEDVFLVAPDDPNRNALLTTVTRNGYAVAQEYVAEARHGDRRLLLLDGEPLVVDGRPAIYARRRPEDDLRSNLHVGGSGEPAEFRDADARAVAPLRDRLRAEGLYLVGVDLVGDRVLELNVHAPGGIHNVSRFQGVNFGEAVIRDLEHRVAERRGTGGPP